MWLYGPYNAGQVSAGSQPDWYIVFLDGSLRMMPNWETHIFHHTISWNILIPGVIIPGIMFTLIALYPSIEAWITKDNGVPQPAASGPATFRSAPRSASCR